MPKGENWSPEEVRATVLDYMAMLKLELAGQPYSKTLHRRALIGRLDGRSEGAVEKKHQNISAILDDMGYFWIPGYKPQSNYQRILAEEVERWVEADTDLDRRELAAAEALAVAPEHFDFSAFEVKGPTRAADFTVGVNETAQSTYGERVRVAVKRDYAAREARNASLGLAGEELVVKFEQYRLSLAGCDRLAEKVEHVSKRQGDGLGFDVLSFEPDGREKFIEVKTTAFAKETPFYATAGEVKFARRNSTQYVLCRLFEFRKAPKCFTLPGAIETHCRLDPASYRCVLS